MPSRNPPSLDVEASLARVRMNADVLAARRVTEMKARLKVDGKADRAVLGIKDPTLGDVLRGFSDGLSTLFGVRPWGDSKVAQAGAQMPFQAAADAARKTIRDRAIADVRRHHDDAVDRVAAAWHVAGSHPAYHRRQQARLRAQWPALARALDALTIAPRPHR